MTIRLANNLIRSGAGAAAAAAFGLFACAANLEAQAPFKAESPFAVTSCGQSLDAETVSLLAKRHKLVHTFNNVLKASDLGGAKTLVVAMGGSAKGLGEAGIDEKAELARVDALLEAARKQKVKVIAVHIGGESRKGALSDKFLTPVIARADFLVVTEDSDKDGSFTKAARARKIPFEVVKKSVDVGKVLKDVFSK
jgi:hypothetical protein